MTKNSRKLQSVHGKLRGGLRRITVAFVALGVAGVYALSSIASTGGGFERTMVSAAVKFDIFNRKVGEGARQYAALTKRAREMGITTEFTARQAAGGFNSLAMSGFSAQQAIKSLPGVLDLATVAETEVGEAAKMAASALGAFGLLSDDAGKRQKNLTRINDTFVATLTSSQADIESLHEAIKTGGPVAHAAGMSIERYSAIVGKLAQAGIKGTLAGTAMKNVFLRLADSNSGRILKRLGVTVSDDAEDFKKMRDIVGELDVALRGFGKVKRARFLDKIFGKRAIVVMFNLLTQGKKTLKGYGDWIKAQKGISKKMAAAMRDVFAVDWLNFIAIIEDLKIQLYELIKGPLRAMIAGMKEWVGVNRGAVEVMGKSMSFLLKYRKVVFLVIAAVTILTATLAAFTAVLGGALVIIGLMVLGATGGWLIAIAAVVAAIGTLGVAIMLWPEVMGAFWDEFKKIWLVRAFTEFIGAQINLIKYLYKAIAFLLTGIPGLIDKMDQAVNTWLASARKNVFAFLDAIPDKVRAMIQAVKNIVKGFSTEGFVDALRTYLPNGMGGLTDEEAMNRETARRSTRGAPVQGPQAFTSTMIQEMRDKGVLTIKDETGRAELDKPMSGVMLKQMMMGNSGAF